MTERTNHSSPANQQPDIGAGTRLPERGSATKFANTVRPVLSPVARSGLVGDIVGLVEPFTEAGPAALTLEVLVGFGHAGGPDVHVVADRARHPARIFGVLVGPTSRGRKGTAHDNIRPLFFDHDYQETSGLSSGEGLVSSLEQRGTYDRKLLVVETEFGRTLRVSQRQHNTLSDLLRQLWDKEDASVMTRKDPLKIDRTHLSVVGHITPEELSARMQEVDIRNGFLNRFLMVYTHRVKIDPFLGRLDMQVEAEMRMAIRQRINEARKGSGRGLEVTFSPRAEQLYKTIYFGLYQEGESGRYEALTARAEAHITRLSLTYALLDGSQQILRKHVEAAYAFWTYCDDTIRWLLSQPDNSASKTLDRIEHAVLNAGQEGLTLTELQRAFSNHLRNPREHVQTLSDAGRLIVGKEATDGAERWTLYHPSYHPE